MEAAIVIHHSEIALKGRKRGYFETKLVDNIKYVLGRGTPVFRDENRLVIMPFTGDGGETVEKLRKIFGIHNVGVGVRVEPTVDEIEKAVHHVVEKEQLTSLWLEVKRSYKGHPFTSQELHKTLVSNLVQHGLQISKNSGHMMRVEVTEKNAYVYAHIVKGFGGLPVDSSGRVLALLSGGVDSAVASLLLMKRGCRVDFLHLHSYRTSDEAVKEKIGAVVEKLTEYNLKSILYTASFTPFYKHVWDKKTRQEIVLFRRYLLRVAEEIALSHGYRALVLGDSLAQVASQTLPNISAVGQPRIPIFRPLIGLDKAEIIELAEKYGIFETVSKPYKDCCSIIARHPATKTDSRRVEKEWQLFGLDAAVEQTLQEIEVYRCTLRAGLHKLSPQPVKDVVTENHNP
ncbi:MAG: tRNA uracil 4-sulfurtransferase ThiI [Candidatus Caldarchaeum sp.]